MDNFYKGKRVLRTPTDVTGPINVGNPVECTILDLAKQVIEMTGSSSSIVFQQASQDDPRQRQPDISLARSKLEWEPQVALRHGLEKTIAYFDGQLRN